MLSSEETNYFGAGACLESSVWRPSPSDTVQYGRLNSSIPRNDSASYINGAMYDDSKGWGSGRPPSDRRWNDQGFENDFTSGKGQHPMGGGEYGSNPNWGRREINQGTPWDMPPPVNRPPPQGFHGDGMQPQNRFMPPNMGMDNGTTQWKSWTPTPGLVQQPWDAMPPPNGGYGAPMPAYGQQTNGHVGNLPPPPLGRSMMPPHMSSMDPQMQQQQQWNGNRAPGLFIAPGANWCQPGAPPSHAGPPMPESHMHARNYDPNPRNTGQWYPQQQNVEPNNDMFWHDPNAIIRKVQRDTGTSVWGDPGSQRGEIRRWKTVENEEYTVSSAVPNGGDWSNIPTDIEGASSASASNTNASVSNADRTEQIPLAANDGAHGGLPTTDSQSRLQQWKKNAGSLNGYGQMEKTTSSMDGGLSGFGSGTQALQLSPEEHNDSHWKSGELNWTNADAMLSESRKQSQASEPFGNAISFNGGSAQSGNIAKTGTTPTPPTDDEIPAFIPGRKWEWRDPNKAAEDPNATPGTCKPNNFLLTDATLSSLNSVWSAQTSDWDERRNDPTQLSDMSRHQSTPAALMQRPPFPMFGNDDNVWVLFQLTNVHEQQVGPICGRLNGLHCLLIVGNKIACAKLKHDVNVDSVLQRIQAEFAVGPQELKVVPDEEFDAMMRATRQSNIPVSCAWSANGEVGPSPLSNA